MMTPLRQRMTEDMQVRNLALNTQTSYVQQVSLFARHFNKSPEQLGPEDIRTYQVYLTNEKKLAPGSVLIAVAALRFLYKVSLKKDWPFADVIPAPKKPQTLPVVLSPEEVLQFLSCVGSTKHRAILSTCYAAGLRISEAVCLVPTDIDSQRMVVRVDQGKGQKDRYVMLSPKLLEILRTWWRVAKPKQWLFPGDIPGRHISRDAVGQACQKAHHLSGIRNPLRPIRCATHSRFIYWNPARTYGPFNCSLAIAAWRPPRDTCGSPPAKCARHRVRSTCYLAPLPLNPNLPHLSTSERRVRGSPETGSGGCLPPLRRNLS
jgi:integrase/recombinase XerD